MASEFIETLWLTGKLALSTTAILLLVGLPIANWLAHTRFKLKVVVEALICMPMVLPPTVLGFYMLVAFSPQNGFGAYFEQHFGIAERTASIAR